MISSIETYLQSIGGRQTPSTDNAWIESFYPATAKVWARIPAGTVEDVDRAVEAADKAFRHGPWARMKGADRARLLRRLADLISEAVPQLAHAETMDVGKPLWETTAQISRAPKWLHYYAGLADKQQGDTIPSDQDGTFVCTTWEPLGIVVAITPWNVPLLLLIWKIAPALAAGNTIVIKPSEIASVSTLMLATLIEKAGFPEGVVNIVSGYGHIVGEALVSDPRIAKISFTGSEATGRKIAETAGRNLKPVTLELGGKSAQIVFADADLTAAARGICAGVFLATGQTCTAGSRVIVDKSVSQALVAEIKAVLEHAIIGDPRAVGTHIGPLASRAQYEKVLDFIRIGAAEGATPALKGGALAMAGFEDGWFCAPTIFTDVEPNMTIAREEIFGPVLSVLTFEEEEDAVRLANDTRYGLAAGIWCGDMRRAMRLASRIEAGSIFCGMYRGVDPAAPTGGFKSSGMGRENGLASIKDYQQLKTTWINLTGIVADPFPGR